MFDEVGSPRPPSPAVADAAVQTEEAGCTPSLSPGVVSPMLLAAAEQEISRLRLENAALQEAHCEGKSRHYCAGRASLRLPVAVDGGR